MGLKKQICIFFKVNQLSFFVSLTTEELRKEYKGNWHVVTCRIFHSSV